MTKAELVDRMSQDSGITKKAATEALNALVEAVNGSLSNKDGSIRITDLGTFRVVHRKARNGVNPQTGKKMKIKATNVPRFTASKALKETVKKAK